MSPSLEVLAAELRALISTRQFAAVIAFWETRGRPLHADQTSCRAVAAAFAELGQLERALSVLAPWLRRSDCDPVNFALAGRLALDLGQSEIAVSYLTYAVRAQSGNVAWWRLLAEAALIAGTPAAALAHVTPHRLRFYDDDRLAYLLIRLLIAAGRTDEALLEFERALARWPGHSEMGYAFARFVTFEYPLVAADLLDRVQWKPNDDTLTPSRVSGSLAMPAFHATDDEVSRWHLRIIAALRELEKVATLSPLQGDARACCLDATMFFAPYTEKDVTELMFAWGDFVEALVAPLRNELRWSANFLTHDAKRPVRTIGFVTNRSPSSSAGRLFHAWVEIAAQSGFDVHVFALGAPNEGDATISATAKLTRFPEEHPKHWRVIAEHMLAAECELLIYPEPQGSALQMLLAGIKLAPQQAAGFGNPVTTGLRTMDYFLSPAEAEPPGSERHYREQLVLLRDTWSALEAPPAASTWNRAAFGGDEGEHWYLVAQPMMKWTPQFRAALISILKQDPLGRLVFFQWSLAFSPRAFELMLRDEFLNAGLDYARRTHLIGFLNHHDYMAVLSTTDVALDTFGFSGGVSTADAIATGLPVVTLRGDFLRGRQSAILVEQMGECRDVVANCDDFISRTLNTVQARQTTTTKNFLKAKYRRNYVEAVTEHTFVNVAPGSRFLDAWLSQLS